MFVDVDFIVADMCTTSVWFSPSFHLKDQRILAASNDQTARVWSIADKKQLVSVFVHVCMCVFMDVFAYQCVCECVCWEYMEQFVFLRYV